MIVLTTSLKCNACGVVIAASIIARPEEREADRTAQLEGLMGLAREHRCKSIAPIAQGRRRH